MRYLTGIVLIFLIGCKPTDFAGKLAAGANYTRYISTLEKSGLTNTAMGKEWISIGQNVLKETKEVELPYQDEGYFTSNRIDAKSYQLELKKGTTLEVTLRSSPRTLELFLDVFYLKERNDRIRYEDLSPIEPNRRKLQFKIKNNGTHVIRLQSALLLGGRYEIAMEEI
ncbi:MAG: hypothetical protein AAGG68_21395 [Bacteroidota bacterium]